VSKLENVKSEQEKIKAKVKDMENDLLLKKVAGKAYAKEILKNRSEKEKEDLRLKIRERLGNDPAELERLTGEAEKEGHDKQEAILKALDLEWQPAKENDPEDRLNGLLDQGVSASQAWQIIRQEFPDYFNQQKPAADQDENIKGQEVADAARRLSEQKGISYIEALELYRKKNPEAWEEYRKELIKGEG